MNIVQRNLSTHLCIKNSHDISKKINFRQSLWVAEDGLYLETVKLAISQIYTEFGVWFLTKNYEQL